MAAGDFLTWAVQAQDAPAHVGRLVASALLNEGVVDVAGDSFQVAQDTGSNMQIKVGSGTLGDLAVVEGDDTAGQGTYVIEAQNATVTKTIAAADASNDRIDLVVLQNYDDEADSSGNNDAEVEVIEGTPAGSPSAPALPDSAISLAEVLVGAGVTAITDANITDKRVEATVRPEVAGPPMKRFERATSAQSIPNSSVTVVDFNSEVASSDGSDSYFSESAGTVTVLKAGWVRMSAGIDWATSATGTRLLVLRHNGDRVASDRAATSTSSQEQNITTAVKVAANDTVDAAVVQDTGGALDVDADPVTHLVVEFLRV